MSDEISTIDDIECLYCNKKYKSLYELNIIDAQTDKNYNPKTNRKIEFSFSCPHCDKSIGYVVDYDNEKLQTWFNKFGYKIQFVKDNGFELYHNNILLNDEEALKIYNEIWKKISDNMIFEMT